MYYYIQTCFPRIYCKYRWYLKSNALTIKYQDFTFSSILCQTFYKEKATEANLLHLSRLFAFLIRHSSPLSWCGNCRFRRVSCVRKGPIMKARQHHSNEFQHNEVHFILVGLYIIGYPLYFSSIMMHDTSLWKPVFDARILLTGSFGTNIGEIRIKLHQYSYKKYFRLLSVTTIFDTPFSCQTEINCGFDTRKIYSSNRCPITI